MTQLINYLINNSVNLAFVYPDKVADVFLL